MPELGSSSCRVFSGQAKELNSYGKLLPSSSSAAGLLLRLFNSQLHFEPGGEFTNQLPCLKRGEAASSADVIYT